MRTDFEQIARAYRRMANEVGYRPAAPSDGFGNITIPAEELDLDAEIETYAMRFIADEDDGRFLGCANSTEREAMVYLIEAARLCCTGFGARGDAMRFAEMAVEELR